MISQSIFSVKNKASRRKGRGFEGGVSDRDDGDYDRVEEVGIYSRLHTCNPN